MDNFEKRLFLTNFEKNLDNIDITSYNFSKICDLLADDFDILFKKVRLKYSSVWKSSEEEVVNIKNTLKNQLKTALSKTDKKKTLLEKKFKIIRELFELSEIEYNFFIYYSLYEISDYFKHLIDCFNNLEIENIIMRYFLSLPDKDSYKYVSRLVLKNLLIRKRRGEEINAYVLKILGDNGFDTKQKIVAEIIGKKQKSTLKINDFEHLKDDAETVVKILQSAVKQRIKGVNILLHGTVGTGKTEFAKLTANVAKIPMYQVAVEDEYFHEAKREDRLCDLRTKNQILRISGNACILFDEAEDVMNRGFSFFGSASKGYLNNLLENIDVPVFWTTNNIHDVDPAFLRRMTYCVGFEKLSEEIRLNIWNRTLKKYKFNVNKKKIIELNKNYNVSPSLIANAVKTAKMTGGSEEDFVKYIENVAKVVTKKKNVKKAKEFEMTEYDENLVNTDLDIKNLTKNIKDCGKLNFSLCLYGEPGTGKSLYAKYLAKELGIEVIFKRASDIMGMYVGQTEHNIAEAFAEARSKKAMLIFDEADSFLQNRNNAFRSWEISHVNEMLTQMESHEYPFVCTTNLLNTLDEASLRRFTFKIKFDFMTNEQAKAAFEHFFGIKDYDLGIKGLTAGDFATVKKKSDFLNITDAEELKRMLLSEVKLKSSKELKNAVGF